MNLHFVRKNRGILGIAFLLLTIAGIVGSVQSYFIDRIEGHVSLSTRQILLFNLPFWWYWFCVCPLIFWLSGRFPFHRKRLIIPVLFHLLFSVLLVMIHELLTSAWCNHVFGSLYYMPVQNKFAYRMTHYQWPYVGLFIYWVILGAYCALDYYRQYRERAIRCAQLDQQLTLSRLQTLRMQLRPHFLFNTLNALSTLVKKGENVPAQKLISRFAGFLRMTVEESGSQMISLEEELHFIKGYLDVEKVRFQDKLNIHFSIDPETLGGAVPSWILQPLVENALRHAIMPNESAGKLSITSARDDGHFRLSVEDDGPGLPVHFDLDRSGGIGLKNVRDRLSTLYGDRAVFRLMTPESGGLRVELGFPFQMADRVTRNRSGSPQT